MALVELSTGSPAQFGLVLKRAFRNTPRTGWNTDAEFWTAMARRVIVNLTHNMIPAHEGDPDLPGAAITHEDKPDIEGVAWQFQHSNKE